MANYNIFENYVLLQEIMDDDLDFNIIFEGVQQLVQPPAVIAPKRVVPVRNEDYYEAVIPSYNWDDFQAHFRMSRRTFQCDWPQLDPKNEDATIEKTNEAPLRALILTDTHLLGPIRGNLIEKTYLEWQMHQNFQIAIKLHQPEVVFVLGDLIDEGEYATVTEFNNYVSSFYNLFTVPKNIQMFIVVGNHDIGFHYTIQPHLTERFATKFKSPYVDFITIRNNHFVLVNSIGFEGDACYLCNSTEYQLMKIEYILKCSKGEINCDTKTKLKVFSRPILLQHFPLYRESDKNCSEPDEAPYPEKVEKFKEAWDCLSKNATDKLLYQIEPRLVVCGHTHHGCTTNLPNGKGIEITIPSFNWKHKNNPSYGLLVITPNNYAFSKCLMPRHSSAIIRYVIAGSCLILGMMYWHYRTKKRKPRYFLIA